MSTRDAHVSKVDDTQLRIALADAYSTVLGGPGPETPTGKPISLPGALNAMSVEDAYAFQRAVLDEVQRTWDATAAGYKLSITSAADQAIVDATEPTAGILTDRHLLPSGSGIDLNLANEPLIEAELVARTIAELDPRMTLEELASAVTFAGALEIPTSRFADWWPAGKMPRLTLSGLIADNSVAGFVVIGDTWCSFTSDEIAAIEVRLDLPSGDAIVGQATRVLGNPLRAVAWLLEHLARSDQRLPIGSVVSTGTFLTPTRVEHGTFRADFGSDLGVVTVHFT
jgi:2-keto-4-pentenoate hydratase